MKKICELLLPSFVTALLFWVMREFDSYKIEKHRKAA